jgi:hypothetical protein
MLDTLQSTDFRGCLNQVFRLRREELDPIPLELVSVTELGAPYVPGGRPPFTLLFLGPPSSQYLLQGTYHLEHDGLGAFDLFVVPLGSQAGRMRYEAVFT